MHFLGVFDQLVSKIGVGDADKRLGALPGGLSFEVHHTVFGDNVLGGRARVRDDGAVPQRRQNAGGERAVVIFAHGRAANEALAALGEIGPQHKIELTARAGDVAKAG